LAALEMTHAASTDEERMRAAIAEAQRAVEHGDVPVGALALADDGKTLRAAHNRREAAQDPTAHAEVLALRALGEATGRWNLEGSTLFVTQEPCPMCAGAIVNARVARLVYGCDNPKAGAVRTLYRLLDEGRLNHRVEVVGGVLAAECGKLLSDFFRSLRNQ
jgi:tRNA(adenine34) deaminase